MTTHKDTEITASTSNVTTPRRSRRVTPAELLHVIDTAREAAQAASDAVDAVSQAIESGAVKPTNEGKVAFEEFMAKMAGTLKKAGNSVEVSEKAGWIKIESTKNGHKIYVSKGKNKVSRIESTLSPDLVEGATEPDRRNGRIASLIPANTEAVESAIDHLVNDEGHIRPARSGVSNK